MATIQTRYDGVKYLNYTENGKRERLSLGKIDDDAAETIRLAKEYELRTGIDPLAKNFTYLFQDLANKYLEWHEFKVPDSHERIRQMTEQHIMPFFRGRHAALTTLDGEDYLKKRQKDTYGESKKKYAVGTINKELTTLNAILNKGVEWDLIEKNRIKIVGEISDPESKPPHYYSKKKLQLIYQDINGAMWKFLANTGLRRGEAIGLKWDNVHDDNINVLSTGQHRTKSKKWRTIPLTKSAKEALKELEKMNDDYQFKAKAKRDGEKLEQGKGAGSRCKYDPDYVFPRINKRSLSRWFDNVVDGLGLEGSIHSLRHTFCSQLVMAGKTLRVVQVLAGHADSKTTEKYAHLAPDYLQSSVESLDF